MAATARPARIAPASRADRLLLVAGALFALAVVVHNGDHLRRGADSVTTDVVVAGTLGIVFEVGVVALIAARHRLAPLAALAVGAALAPAYLFVHFTPGRSWLSDSFPSSVDVSPMSWFAASFEVVGATLLALAGWAALQERGGLASAGGGTFGDLGRGAREGLRHPLVAVFLAINLVIVVVTLVQL